MFGQEPSRYRRWMTPRFPVEMAGASLLTLGLMLSLGAVGRQAAEPPNGPPKIIRQVAPLAKPMDESDERNADFIEKFALAHVGQRLPEDAMAEPDQARATSRPAATASNIQPPAATRVRPPNPRVATVLPPSRPASAPPPKPPDAPNAAAPKGGLHIPIISDVAENIGRKIPSGQQILDGVGSIGRKIGSILGRS